MELEAYPEKYQSRKALLWVWNTDQNEMYLQFRVIKRTSTRRRLWSKGHSQVLSPSEEPTDHATSKIIR